jgi:hypothetical protein
MLDACTPSLAALLLLSMPAAQWPASGAVAHERPDSNRLCGERRPLMLEQDWNQQHARRT